MLACTIEKSKGVGNAGPASEAAGSRHSLDAIMPGVLAFSRIHSFCWLHLGRIFPDPGRDGNKNSSFNLVSEMPHEKIACFP